MAGRQSVTTKETSLPGAVWALGLTSLCMDISSELIHGLLPLFLVLSLGASPAMLGLIAVDQGRPQITFAAGASFAAAALLAFLFLGSGAAAKKTP